MTSSVSEQVDGVCSAMDWGNFQKGRTEGSLGLFSKGIFAGKPSETTLHQNNKKPSTLLVSCVIYCVKLPMCV